MKAALLLGTKHIDWFGRLVSWIVVPLMLVVVYEVVARYAFNSPHSWSMDIISWLMASHFMLAAGYTLLHDRHIRMDIVYARLSTRLKAVADIVGYCLLFLPFVAVTFWASGRQTLRAWEYHEMTASSPPLPLYAVKTFVPVAMFVLLVSGVVCLIRALWVFKKGEEP